MPPRLLAVAAVAEPGGAEVHLLRLIAGLRERGWDVTLTTPPTDTPPTDPSWLPLDVGGLAARAGARALLSWPRARRLGRDHDVVYLNGTVCGRLLPALGAVRTVLHVHDMVDRVPRLWRRADVVLADSGAVAARLTGLDAHVVYGPIDLDPPPADPPWPDPERGPVIGYLGRLEPRKGVLDLVAATPAIHAARPGARVVLVGDDPYGADPDYLAQVHAAEGVERYGWVANGPGVMRHLDVLVLPSHREPFGTVLSEAMAVGTPVVATAVDGLPEVVEDGVTGRLVAPNAPDQVAEAVLHVLEHRDAMSAAARVAARRFEAQAYVDRVAELINP